MRVISDDSLGIVTVFQEAEGEPYEGKVAVAEVILRRTKMKYMSDGTVTGTVLRRLQFSGMNSDAANRIRSFQIDSDTPKVKECIEAWNEAKEGSNRSNGATHYYNPKIASPAWAEGAKITATIGDHRFVIAK